MFDHDLTELFETFVAEAVEDIAALENGLLALESTPDDTELRLELQRHAHTLKGSASCLGLAAITEFAHAYEEVLERITKNEQAVDAALINLLLGGIDTFRRLVEEGEACTLRDEDRARIESLVGAVTASPGAVREEPHERQNTAPVRPQQAKSVRVSAMRLNRMLDLTGEIAIQRGRVRELLSRIEDDELLELDRQAGILHTELQELVMRARMVPIGPLFRQYARTVRDLAAAHGKNARLVTIGEQVELDTSAVEMLRDPLTHMIRNAIDHGLEPTPDRIAKGKPPVGEISLEAHHEAGAIVIRISDDGAGLNRNAIRNRAQTSADNDAELLELIFAPGFSTASAVSDLSGRGVGMDVVRRAVESLRGTIGVTSSEGTGTTFTIRLPLTLALIDGFRIVVEDETYVVPMDHVRECIELPACAGDDSTGTLLIRNEVVPFVRLRMLFNLGGKPPARENVLIVEHGGRRAGFAVDVLEGASQAVVKPLGGHFQDVQGVAGSSILGNGRVALILDTPGILRSLSTATA